MKPPRLLSIIIAIAILSSSLLTVVSTAETEGYSGYLNMAKLSKAEVVALTKDHNVSSPLSFYVSKPSVTAPYSMGQVRNDLQQNALERMNAYRRLAGLPAVTINSEYTHLAQAASVVNAVNNEMTHYPVRPENMADDLYNDGYEGASHSNIACYKGYEPLTGPISFSVDLWMDDSDEYNIDRLGHRRWVLNPTMSATGFGCATSADGWVHTAMYAFDSNATHGNYDYISWPPSGYMVNDTDFFTTDCAWSISLHPGKYPSIYMTDIEVTLTDSKGREWEFDGDADDDGFFNVELGGYGSTRNAIIFRPDNISKFEGVYTVTVESVKTFEGLMPVEERETIIVYQVEFFSAKNYVEETTKETTTVTTTAPTTESTTETTTVTTTVPTTEPTTEATTVTTTLPTTEATTVTTTVTTTETTTATTTETTTENTTVTTEPAVTEITSETDTTESTTVPSVPVKKGDLNGDNKVNAIDARIALRIAAQLVVATQEQLIAADVNKDGKVNATDARKILRVSAQLEVFEEDEEETTTESTTVANEEANDTVVTTTEPPTLLEEATTVTTTAAETTTKKLSIFEEILSDLVNRPEKESTTAEESTTSILDDILSGIGNLSDKLQNNKQESTTEKSETTTEAKTTVVPTTKTQPSDERAVVIAESGNEYHDISCIYIICSDIKDDRLFAVSESEAKRLGYTPCKNCI